MTDAADRSAAALRDAIARGELTVRAAAHDALGRAASVKAGPDGLNILLYQDSDLGDRCRTVQDAVDAKQAGPLAGVPVVIKDNIATTTLPTSCGSRILEGYVSPYRATAVARLEQAGAVIVAKSNMDEFAMGSSTEQKTTLLNVLSGFIPNNERIVTIEDAAELQLRQDHVVRLETRPANIEGKGEIAQRELVKNALRMRPDRIILGEVRGAESLDMLQAMNTGHDGSLTTVHANSCRDALTRIETLVSMAGLNLATKAMRHYVSSALDVIVQIARLSDGSRKLISLQEVVGMEGDLITLQELFVFQQTGLDENRKVKGRFRATGVRPKFAERLAAKGVALPAELFDPQKVYEC